MTRIKICGITRLEDARAAVDAGAHALGLVFYRASPRYIEPPAARDIINRLPPFAAAVGLFVDPERSFVTAVLETVPLDIIQFHGNEDPEFCGSFGRPYIKAVRVQPDIDLHKTCRRYAGASALLLDSHSETAPGGTGMSFDWSIIPPGLSRPVILAGGLTAANVRRAIEVCRPYAVDVSSGVELDKGIKDKGAMTEFIREVLDVDDSA